MLFVFGLQAVLVSINNTCTKGIQYICMQVYLYNYDVQYCILYMTSAEINFENQLFFASLQTCPTGGTAGKPASRDKDKLMGVVFELHMVTLEYIRFLLADHVVLYALFTNENMIHSWLS